MVKSIFQSVGRMGGKNRPDDVITIQQLLNKPPAAKGGAMPPLDVDGLCGPKTIDAIQKFQLHHFGWPGADGRVDPNGPTLKKLNEFDALFPDAPPPVTSDTNMFCSHGGAIKGTSLRGTLVLTTSDKFTVSSCPFSVSPCVQVRWLGPPGKALNKASPGMCLNAGAIPQGPVRIT
jgi:hypothetical protein